MIKYKYIKTSTIFIIVFSNCLCLKSTSVGSMFLFFQSFILISLAKGNTALYTPYLSMYCAAYYKALLILFFLEI